MTRTMPKNLKKLQYKNRINLKFQIKNNINLKKKKKKKKIKHIIL